MRTYDEQPTACLLASILDDLDAADPALCTPVGQRRIRWPYRRTNLRVDLVLPDNAQETLRACSRTLEACAITFIANRYIEPLTPCAVHLFTTYNMWRRAAGRTTTCSYVGRHLYEVHVRLEQRLEVPLFISEAVERRVLIVDRDPGSGAATARQLNADDATIVSATNLARALAETSRHRFDVIMIDTGDEPAFGAEALHRLRAGGAAEPAVALVSTSAPRMERELLNAGFDACIRKPLDDTNCRTLISSYAFDPVLSVYADRVDLHEQIAAFVRDLPARVDAVRLALSGQTWTKLAEMCDEVRTLAEPLGFEPIAAAAAAAADAARNAPADCACISRLTAHLAEACGRARGFPYPGSRPATLTTPPAPCATDRP